MIRNDFGGWISEYEDHYAVLAARGGEVEVRGDCESACTLVTVFIPKERLCFSFDGLAPFYKVRTEGKPSNFYTQQMVDSYPADIRGWIVAKGGVAQMPTNTYWTLPAHMLWIWGYRRCPPHENAR